VTLPPETVNATLGVHDLVNAWMDERAIYDEPRAYIHDLIDRAVRQAHTYALAGAGRRILTVAEVADRLGISVMAARKRIAEASPPILPVKRVGPSSLYMVEDLPAIATVHIQGVIGEGRTTRYVAAKMRKAIAQVHHKATIKRLQKAPTVRWPDFDGSPITVKLPVARTDYRALEIWAKQDGWTGVNHLLQALIVSYTEVSKRWKEKP